MKRSSRLRLFPGLFLAAALACSVPNAPTSPSAGPTPTPAPTARPPATNPPVVAEHRIGIRAGAAGMEFYDRITVEHFVPRGVNYNRWVFRDSPTAGRILVDAIFNTEFGDMAAAAADLEQIASLGFNAVRVWRNACWGNVGGCIGDPRGGLSDEYMDNLVEFLRQAKELGLYVIFTDDWVPDDGGYSQTMQRGCCMTFDGYNNAYLTGHGIAAERAYLQDFIRGLIERGAPLDAILAYELRNEAFYEANLPPFSLSAGTVTAANGTTYDLASQGDRQRLMEEGWLHWSDQLRAAILEVDPTALVTMGFFVQHGPNPVRQGDARTVYLDRMVRESNLDFLDLHAYPGYDLNLRQHVENFALIGEGNRLLVLGEFGADKNNYTQADRAAAALQAWQAESCNYGFDGWFMWNWSIFDFWTPMEDAGQVGAALSPGQNPDPCVAGGAGINLALFRPVRASHSEGPDYAPERAVDGSLGTWWSAGDGPPQWIEIDLEDPASISRVVLQPGWVSATGPQRVRVLVRGPGTGGADILFHEFQLSVQSNTAVEYVAPQPATEIRWVRFETVAANGWVIWHEFEVYP
jgi:hypothetical protein